MAMLLNSSSQLFQGCPPVYCGSSSGSFALLASQGASSYYDLQPGAVLSIEPGYYQDGGFGIRIENLVAVEKCVAGFLTMSRHCARSSSSVQFPFQLIYYSV